MGKDRVKICFITNNINQYGGIERVIKLLSDYFVEKWCVSIVSLYSNRTDLVFEFSDTVEIIHCNLNANDNLRKFLIDFFKKNEFNICFTFHADIALEFARIKKRIPKVKWIATEHCSPIYYSWKRKIVNLIVYRYAHKLVLLTNEYQKYYKRRLIFNSCVIPNPVSFETKEKSNCRSKNIIAIGRLEKVKGFDLLIRAFSCVANDNPEWKLKIIGEGNEKKDLVKIVEVNSLQKQVEFLGFQKDIMKFLLEASILAISSQSEGFPLVVIEGMEVGLPILSVDLPVMREIDNNGKFIQIVNDKSVETYAMKMQELMSCQEVLCTYGIEAKRCARKYHLSNIGKKWEELIESIIDFV